MSVAETVYRFRDAIKKKSDQKIKKGYLPKGILFQKPKPILFSSPYSESFDLSTYNIFGQDLELNEKINWHRDLHSGKEFPMDFSFSINTRSGQYGNVKVVWEVNRLQFLTGFCLKYKQTKHEEFLDRFMDIITQWHVANPYLYGVNWYSNIELNLRIITWFFCWEILDATSLISTHKKFANFTNTVWLPLIELHAEHAFRYPSKYSSANNHLVAEAAGLFIAGSYWKFKHSERWKSYGQKVLESQIHKQHTFQGVNREEASEYIQFIADFFLIPMIVGQRTGSPYSKKYSDKWKEIMNYVYHLMDCSGNLPYYGDDDDGHVVQLGWGKSTSNFSSLLASASIIFKNPSFKTKATFDLKNHLLFGEQGYSLFNNFTSVNGESKSLLLKESGHFLLKTGKGNKELYCHADIAPLGYLSIAAHGHADALSFFLHLDGQPYIIDVGTYTYHTEPEWRSYFKGTLAHNTIRVDQIDQATYAGPSLWLDHYSTKLHLAEENDKEIVVKGSHNGYKSKAVDHLRTFHFDKEKEKLEVIDEIRVRDKKNHLYEFPLHLHPDVQIQSLTSHNYLIKSSQGRALKITLCDSFDTKVIQGQENPILGWYSPSFLVKTPNSVIYSKQNRSGSFTLRTVFQVLNQSHHEV